MMMHGLANFKLKEAVDSAQIVIKVYRGKTDFMH
jgi:hypothetical protein